MTVVVLVVTLFVQAPGSSSPALLAATASPTTSPGPTLVPLLLVDLEAVERTAPRATPVPPPEPVIEITIGVEAGDEVLQEAIEQWMALLWTGYVPRFVDPFEEPAGIAISRRPPDHEAEAILLESTSWVAVTHFTSEVEDVGIDDLRAAFKGEWSSWADLDGPDVPIARVLVARNRYLAAAVLGLEPDDLADVDVMTAEEFAERAADLARERNLLMVVPLALADVRFRALGVSGANPLFQQGSEAEYPLLVERWLAIRPDGIDGERGHQFREGLIRFLSDDLATPASTVATVTAVGDIIFGRKVDQRLTVYGDYTRPFHLVGDELRRADLTLANLECTLTDQVRPPHDWSTFSFGTSIRAVEGLLYAGIDVVSLANNHSRDMGPQPFLQMLDVLTEAEIGYVGAGRNLDEAHTPTIVDVRGTRIAILGYDDIGFSSYGATERTPGTAAMSEAAVGRDVAAARDQADVVIPFFHWGTEYTNQPTERQRRVAHAAVDAGAAMVLGSHAHWVQAVEFYEGALIVYGLGNFVFDQSWSTETTQGVILHTSWVDGRLASARFVPIQIEDLHQPRILDRRAGRPILDRMFSVSDL